MILLTLLVIFLTFIIDCGNGKPTSSCELKTVGPRIAQCLFTLANMTEAMKHAKELNEVQELKYLKDCEYFMACKPDFECTKAFNREMDVAFRVVEIQCKSARFMVTEFKDCDKKLEILNSTCQQNYNPFPSVKVEDVPEIMKNGRSQKCEDLFIEGDCMRADVLKVCGKTQWEKFRLIQMELAEAMRLCQMDE